MWTCTVPKEKATMYLKDNVKENFTFASTFTLWKMSLNIYFVLEF